MGFTSPTYSTLLQELNALTYSEADLPPVPQGAPGVVAWLLRACLRRDPARRPPACLVADVLHVWCLLRQLNRLASTSNEILQQFNVR